jgi:hypothetical protein
MANPQATSAGRSPLTQPVIRIATSNRWAAASTKGRSHHAQTTTAATDRTATADRAIGIRAT